MDVMGILEITLKTLFSMLIGGVIGWERESTHRPAGLRTHMLVAVGSCVIMQLGQYTATLYMGQTNIDPARLGAQVISGIGFLGAGTIMKDGPTIRGLTTAASLWVVACLGLAVGYGAYAIAIIGFVAIMLTLTVFERASSFVPGGKHTRFIVKIKCDNPTKTLVHVKTIAEKYGATISDIELKLDEDAPNRLSFNLSTHQSRHALEGANLLQDLTSDTGISSIKMSEY